MTTWRRTRAAHLKLVSGATWAEVEKKKSQGRPLLLLRIRNVDDILNVGVLAGSLKNKQTNTPEGLTESWFSVASWMKRMLTCVVSLCL